MHLKELIYLMNNYGSEFGGKIDETIHMTADEPADDVKIYIRHNTQVIKKDFTNGKKIEKELTNISL